MDQRPVPPESVEVARKLAKKEPWNCRWRVLLDGSLEVAYLVNRRNVLARIWANGSHEELARSDGQSTLSVSLEKGLYVAFLGFILVFTTWWALIPLVGGAAAFAIGAHLDRRPNLADWARERSGSGDEWAPMPRMVGELPPTGNQLFTLCRIARHGRFERPSHDTAQYCIHPDGVVEVAFSRDGGHLLIPIDAMGREGASRRIEGKLKRAVPPFPRWHSVQTGDPPGD